MSPSIGSEYARAQYSAPKNAPKNITSEKMNQLMLQRYETSTRSEYMPPSLSPMASRNHTNSVESQITTPSKTDHLPQPAPFPPRPAPRIIKPRPSAVIAGWRDGAGTK